MHFHSQSNATKNEVTFRCVIFLWFLQKTCRTLGEDHRRESFFQCQKPLFQVFVEQT